MKKDDFVAALVVAFLLSGCAFWRQDRPVDLDSPLLYVHEYESLSCSALDDHLWMIRLQLELLTEGLSASALKKAIAEHPKDESVKALLELRGRKSAIKMVRDRKCP